MRRVGVLVGLAADDPLAQAHNAAFLQGLGELGWNVGRNLQIDFRWGAGDTGRYARYAAELVELAPDVILAIGASVVWSLLHATRTVPVVFVQVTDAVGAGYVANLARPGGNATGFTLFEFGISAKWIELLKQIAPSVTRAAVLLDPMVPSCLGMLIQNPFAARSGHHPSVGLAPGFRIFQVPPKDSPRFRWHNWAPHPG